MTNSAPFKDARVASSSRVQSLISPTKSDIEVVWLNRRYALEVGRIIHIMKKDAVLNDDVVHESRHRDRNLFVSQWSWVVAPGFVVGKSEHTHLRPVDSDWVGWDRASELEVLICEWDNSDVCILHWKARLCFPPVVALPTRNVDVFFEFDLDVYEDPVVLRI